jgi:hypothetical protein
LKIKGVTHLIFASGCNTEILAGIIDFVAFILVSKAKQIELKEGT